MSSPTDSAPPLGVELTSPPGERLPARSPSETSERQSSGQTVPTPVVGGILTDRGSSLSTSSSSVERSRFYANNSGENRSSVPRFAVPTSDPFTSLPVHPGYSAVRGNGSYRYPPRPPTRDTGHPYDYGHGAWAWNPDSNNSAQFSQFGHWSGSFPMDFQSHQGPFPPLPPNPPPPSNPPLPSPPSPPSTPESALGHPDELACGSESESQFCDDTFSSCEENNFSFVDAIQRLSLIDPEAVVSSVPVPSTHLSAAQRAMGLKGVVKKSQSKLLKESSAVVEKLQEVWVKARGQVEPPTVGCAPCMPGALSCGTFVTKSDVLPGGKFVSQEILPYTKLQVGREDLLLVDSSQAKLSRSVEIKDKTLSDFEHLAACGLSALSAVDSFMGGLVCSVVDTSAPEFTVKQDVNKEDFHAMVDAMSESMKMTASALSALHANLVLTRRDALLVKSKVVLDAAGRASLRSVPLHNSALFGNDHITPAIHKLAETRRDIVMATPHAARPSLPSQQGRGRGTHSTHSQRSHSSPASTGRGGKSRGGGSFKKPYERKQAPKAQAKPHPQ